MSFLSSKFGRIGSEAVKWEFSLVLVKLSSPSLTSATVTIERGEHKNQSRTINQKVDGYFMLNETMSMIVTLYRKKDHQYLPKIGTLLVHDRSKLAGQCTFDFAKYVDDDRNSIVGLEEDWRLEKAVDKFNSFVTVKVSAKKIGSGEINQSVNQSSVNLSKAESEQKEDSEISEDEIPIPKARNSQPSQPANRSINRPNNQPVNQSAKRKPVLPDSDDEVLHDDSDEQVVDDDDDDYAPPPPARNSARSPPVKSSNQPTNQSTNQSAGTSFRNKPKQPVNPMFEDSDDDSDAPPLQPVSRRNQPVGQSINQPVQSKPVAAPKPKPTKDMSGMSAKERLFADLDDDTEDEAPRPSKKAAAKSASQSINQSKSQPAGSNARDQLLGSNARDQLFAPPSKDTTKGKDNAKGKSSSSPQASPVGRSNQPNPSTKSTKSSSKSINLSLLAKPARSITANQLFSCSLAESATVMPSKEMKDAPKNIPFILHFLLFHIERLNGLSTSRLFKDYVEPVKSDEVKLLMEDPRVNVWKLKKSQENPHVLGAVLKVWLQSLTDGLIPEQLHDALLSIGALVNDGEDDEAVNQPAIDCLSKLPAVHRASLFALCDFLYTMSIPPYNKRNGMTAASLASTFAPVIAHIKVDPSKGAYEQFEEKNQINKAVEFLIRNPTIIEEAGDVAVDNVHADSQDVKFHDTESHDDHDEHDDVVADESDEVINESEEEELPPPSRKQPQNDFQSRKQPVDASVRKQPVNQSINQPIEQPKPKKPIDHSFFDDDEDDEVIEDEEPAADSDASDDQPRPTKQSQSSQPNKQSHSNQLISQNPPSQSSPPPQPAKAAPVFDPRKQAEIERLRALRGKSGKSPEPASTSQPINHSNNHSNNHSATQSASKQPISKPTQAAAGKSNQWELNFFDDSDEEVAPESEDEPVQPTKSQSVNQSRLPPPSRPEPPRHSPSPQPPPPPPPKEAALRASESPHRSESPLPAADNVMMLQSTSRILELESANARLTADLETARKQIAAAVSSSSHMSSSHIATQAEVAELKKKLEHAANEREQLVKDKKELQSKLKESALAAAALPIAKSSNPDVRALQDRLAMFELQLEAQSDEFAAKIEAEREVRARLKLEISHLKDENEVLRQRHLRFDDLQADAEALKEVFRGKDAMSVIIDQQRQRIEYLERIRRENDLMMKQAKDTWHATAAMLEKDMQSLQQENQSIKQSLIDLSMSKGKSSKQFDMSLFESLKRSYAALKFQCAAEQQARAELEHSAESVNQSLNQSLKQIISLEDDNKMLKDELTKTGIALKTIADDNFELKEYMRLHTKGKK